MARLALLPDLAERVQGIDRGMHLAAACSDGSAFKLEDSAKPRIAQLDRRKRHYQRSAARKPKGSRRREKAQGKASRRSAQIAAIRDDFQRKTAFRIAQDAPEVVALENLNLKGMTRRAKPRRDEATGRWLRNGAVRKTGLNRALAGAGMGKLRLYLEQALRKLGKTAGSARAGPTRSDRPQGRGAVSRSKGEQPSAAPEMRETPSF